jgi:sulfoacetaldehyde dehydrogenase
VAIEEVYAPTIAALVAQGGVMLDAAEAGALSAAMFAQGRLSHRFTAQSAATIAERAALTRPGLERAAFLMVEESGFGADHPFSGEKLSPVLAVYRARDFAHASAIAGDILRYQGAGHSVGLHSKDDARALALGVALPVCRVIVNQAHCFATGGSFDNGVPFSLSMGCGTWGGNSISDNLNYRHFLNITRVVRPLRAPRPEPTEEDLFGAYRRKFGA